MSQRIKPLYTLASAQTLKPAPRSPMSQASKSYDQYFIEAKQFWSNDLLMRSAPYMKVASVQPLITLG